MAGNKHPTPTTELGAADVLAQQAAAVEALAASMPHNANKSKEFGRDNAISPPAGQTQAPNSELIAELISASTLSESNLTAKTSGGAASLDRARVDSSGEVLTTNQGVAVGDNQNSLKAGLRGPSLLEDFILREKITHFDHERIPERIVHARGSAAHGYFEAYEPMTAVTRAAPFQAAGKITPVFVRFSTVAGERGSTDTARDIRGFAVKFYTDEGKGIWWATTSRCSSFRTR